MKFRHFALCSAGALALSIGAATAEGNDPYTHNPTPEERAQTQSLNTQQANDAQANSEEAAAIQQQNAQAQAQVAGEQAQYQADLERYRDRRAEYDYDRTHPDTWWRERYEHATLQHFYDIPRAELIGLRVIGEDGYRIGLVRDVERHDDGRIARVKLVLRNGDALWVPARDLRYDAEDRFVFTDLSIEQIYDMAPNS